MLPWKKLRLKFESRTWKYITLSCLLGFAFICRLTFAVISPISDDEPYYISASLLYVEGFREGLGSTNFVANFEHPPLTKYIMGAFLSLLFPDAHVEYSSALADDALLFPGRMVNVFLGVITIIPLYLLAEKVRKGSGILASVFFSLNPSHAYQSGLASLDVSLVFFGVCSFLFFLRFLDDYSLKNATLLGCSLGLLLGTKWIQPLVFIVPMILLVMINWRKIPGFLASLGMSFTILLALWIPLLWNFGVYRLLDFFSWINNYFITQSSSATSNTTLAYIALWNMSIPELVLFAVCSLIVFCTLLLDFKRRVVSCKRLLPALMIVVSLTAFYVKKPGAVYYWTMVTPFASIVAAETLQILRNQITVIYKPSE